jgi:hypothetical protein
VSLLTETEVRALNEALDDEYHVWSTYDQVIADCGEVPPADIVTALRNLQEASRQRHLAASSVAHKVSGVAMEEGARGFIGGRASVRYQKRAAGVS